MLWLSEASWVKTARCQQLKACARNLIGTHVDLDRIEAALHALVRERYTAGYPAWRNPGMPTFGDTP